MHALDMVLSRKSRVMSHSSFSHLINLYITAELMENSGYE